MLTCGAIPEGCNMRNEFNVEKLDKGYEIRVYEEKGKDIYEEPMKGVASTKAEMVGYFNRWVELDGKGFTFDE